jgi:hypothetical protein
VGGIIGAATQFARGMTTGAHHHPPSKRRTSP